jgi:peptidoglycan/LPS O-acetylase OafA/YrhL
MSILWSSSVVAGLLVLVYLMIAGVPRPQRSSDVGVSHRPRLVLPTFGVFLTVIGVFGYLTEGSSRFSGTERWILVFVTGVAVAVLAAWIVVRVFATPSADPEDDPRFRFQGHVARVSEAITTDRPGRVVFEVDGHRFDLIARSVDNAPVVANTEVVIEQIDGDVATVELWSVVEQRL